MTNKELAAAAWNELTKTTDSYPAWRRKGFPSNSHWAYAKSYLDQVTDVPVPVPTPVPTMHSVKIGDTL